MIELFVYPKGEIKELINPSPFCAKAEILFRILDIDYDLNEFTGNPGKFPNKKLPVIVDNKKTIADSSIIQSYLLNKMKKSLDIAFSGEQKAYGFSLQKMIEEYYYWALLHERWFIDTNWVKLRANYFSHLPFLIRGVIASLARKSTRKSAEGHGLSRHSDDHILNEGRKCIRAISGMLGEKEYILGDQISTFDTTVYAFVSNTLHSPLGPELKKEASIFKNLVDYDQRMFKKLFA